MEGHQGHIATFVLRLIQIRYQCHVFQIIFQRGFFIRMGEFFHSAQEFLNVLHPCLSIIRIFSLILCQQTGLIHQLLYECAQRHSLLHGHEHGHHSCEICDALSRPCRQGRRHIRQCAEEGHFVLPCMAHQLQHRAVANGAFGHVDNAAQAYIVCRVNNHTEVGNHVPHFPAIVELLPSENLVGDAGAHQHFFQYTALGIGTVEHRHITVGFSLPGQLANTVCHPGGFFPFVTGAEQLNRFSLTGFRPQSFLFPSHVVGNHLIGRIQNIGRGAVILLQLNHRSIRVILFEIQNVMNVCATPAVNGLIVITYHAQVAALCRQQLHQLILGKVGILILVHHHIAEAAAIAVQHRRMIRKQGQRLHQQIIEIQRILCLQPIFVFKEHIMNHLTAIVPFTLLKPLVRPHQLILRIGNFRTDFLRGQELFVHV